MRQAAAVVTGAGGAIGSAICARLGSSGYHVVGVDHKATGNESVSSFIRLDLQELSRSSAEEISEYKNTLLDAIGEERSLQLLVNNAATQRLSPFAELSIEDWRSSLDVNLTGPFLLCQILLAQLAKHNGSIVNVGSIHSYLTKPGFVAYATSKAALEGFTQALAVEVGKDVRVSSILPAAVDTPMLRAGFDDDKAVETLSAYHPSGSIASAKEIAEMVLWLSTSKLKSMNGASIRADGGIGSRLHDPY